MGLPSPLRVGLAPSGLRLASRLALRQGGPQGLLRKRVTAAFCPIPAQPFRRGVFAEAKTATLFPVEKNGVWRGARGLAGRAALRPVFFISDTLTGDTE